MMDAPKRKPGRQGTTRAERQALPLCGAANRNKKPCQHPAGWGTSHPGEGRCKNHGGVGQKPSSRYAAINASPRLKELIEQQAAEPDPYNLLPELGLFRALTTDYIERHDQLTSALLAWHASFTTGYDEAVQLWRGQMAEWVEEQEQAFSETRMPPPPPIPQNFEAKPRQLPDILSVGGFLDKIGGLVERIQKRDSEQKITLTDFNSMLDRLGVEAVLAVQEVIPDGAVEAPSPAALRAAVVAAIERRWRTVTL